MISYNVGDTFNSNTRPYSIEIIKVIEKTIYFNIVYTLAKFAYVLTKYQFKGYLKRNSFTKR